MKRILPVLLLCCSALALQAQTECGGKETYPAHYCDCQYNQAKINSISQLNYLNFNDSLWFQGSSTIFTNAGMTAYLFSESDVQVDVYQRCTAKSTLFSFTVPKNQTRDMDAQAIKDRMIAEGVDPSSQMAMRMVFYPVEEGAQCELYCYPYNTGPNSTAKDPLPVLVGMTYVSSHAYDVYELKAENIPTSCALYTQWSEPSNLPCQLTITRGSATGEEVAVHDFLNASTYFRFDPNLLAEVRASGESLFMHYRHDASAAGRIITREAPVTTHVTDTTLCQGKGVEAYGVNYTAPGLVAYNREWVGTSLKVCEYKYNLILTEPEVQYDTLQVHVSELPMLYRGQYLIPSAGACDFDCTIHHDGECDERYLLHVVREYDDYVTACYGEAYEWHGTTYTQNGTYTKILQNSYGCDSIVTLHLTMQTEIPVSEEDATICGGEGYEWNGEMYYETGDYEVRLQDANGCDSIAILHLTVLPADDVVTNQEICHGDSWLWDETGEEYGITIVETAISSKNDKGNASTNANAATPFTINKDAITIDVSKGSVAANGAYYQINSRNTITIASSQGNIRSIQLTCTASGTSTYGPGNINVDNGSYSFSDKIGAWVGDAKEVVFTTSKYVRVSQIIVTYEDYSQEEGSVVIRKPNTHGCEVNYILNWKLVDCSVPDTALFSATACDSYIWHDTEYTSSGTYYYYTTTSSGRERVEILTLTLNKSVNYEQTISACNSYTWTDGEVYTESGTYTQNLQTVNGCDSIVTLHLTINKSIATEETITACDSYTWNNETYTASGDYTYTTTAINGCDSIVTLHLTINKSISTEETITACDSYVWNGETYTESGDYTYTTTAANGCDSVVTLHLTINKSISTEEIITACDSYTWTDGKEYTESGTYTQHLKTVNGCDSIVTLHLTINKSSVASDEYATICYSERYTWNGKDYQSSGDYTITLSNAAGCDSVVTLHLVVLPEAVADTLSVVVGADDLPYLWRGKEYVATGLYVDTEQYTTIDCDSAIHYLDLTVLSAGILDEQSLTLCETELPYLWYDQQLTTSGKYSYVEQYAGTDIDSIQHILNLTVIPTAYMTEYATACDSYEWNGETYTESGDYTYTTTAKNGCDSIVTLHLTVNKTISTEETITACGSYVWNGETYTASGDYTYTTTAKNGCDSIVTLHLTINKPIATDETAVACDSYVWNGETYTASGDYTYTTTATNGCDSIVTLHLTINKSIATEETITACDSHTWNGETYTESGDYVYTTTATNGCDSVVTLHLTLNKTQYAEETITACDSYVWNGKTYTESGDYTYTTTATNGCDSIVTLHLTINKSISTEETIIACDSYTWNGETYTESGEYTYTTTAKNGCDSVVTLHLTINKSITTEETITACDSYTWTDGKVYTESGTYTQHLKTVNACDSIVTLHLTVNKSSVASDEYTTICYGDSYTWNNQIYNNSGDYTLRLANVNGCDSVVTLHLTVLPPAVFDTLNIVIGSNELPYLWRGKEYTSTGTYYDIVEYAHHACDSAVHILDLAVLFTDNVDYADATICESSLPYTWYDEQLTTSGKYSYVEQYVGTDIDSIQHILNLTVIPTAYVTEYATACDSYVWNGKTYTESGDYTYSTTAINGCDSIVTLHLTINKSIATDETVVTCDSYTWNGKTYTESGDYTYTTTAVNGCDSVVTLHLTINKSISTEETITACDSHTWNGETYTESGDYTYTTTATNGCDSIVTLHLTINKLISTEETITACDSYTWNGKTYTASGDYTYTTTATNGCDSIVTLHLTLNKTQYAEATAIACDSYTWNGETYTASGDYTYTTTASNACDSIVTLHLTVNKSIATEETITACDSYTWNGETYTESGDYTYTTTATNGCDSVVTLHLTINKSISTEETITACDSHTWNGETYTESGDYTYTTTATNGCDSVVTLHLTVNKSIATEETIIACDSYTWNGKTYTASGDYTYTTTATNGCDSIVTLHLTLNKTQYAEATAIACDSYTWNGETYTASGDYTYTTTATNGCDSIVTLHLTINKSIATDETVVTCDSYVWNGNTYTESGDYTYTTTATNGCDSIVTLHLTINKSISTEETITACDSYAWNGETYTESGDYTYATTATNGCDSVVTLHLTVNKSIATEETIIACDSYTWNGKTYTASGEYTYSTTAVNACDSIVTLHLTINKSISTEETITACDSYTWNGKTYTESGDYTYTTTAANACDSIVTLYLTINKSIATEETITACDSYTWTDGKVYTESGTYTQHLKTVNGCDSIVTLHLTINKSSVASDEYATICYGDSYTWNNQIYKNSGDYILRLANINGCDSVVTLHLTVLPPAVSDTLNIVIGSNELPYLWRGKEYTSTGTYYDIVEYAHHACDSAVHVLDLTVLFTDNVDYVDATICESSLPYTWYDQQLTTSGKYSYVEQYVGTDIDSIQHILNLTVIPTAYVTEYATACDSYVWNGQTYTESGDYTYTTTATNGCDSIVTLHLTLNKTQYAEATAIACDSYTWNGNIYTASGDYTYTTTAANGCDSIVTLHLTINKSISTEETITACDSYTWNGNTYTASGDYTYTTTATNGCDSIVTLHLTINKSIATEETITACDSHTWNGKTYTASGDYTYTTTAANGCDSIVTLHLTINKTQYAEETVVTCDSYVWNGETYTESGDYTYTTTATNGCDSVVTLHLTINKTQYTEETAIACDSYTWNGKTYTESGDYTYTTTAANGCDSIVTIHLTINKSIATEETVVTCDSYVWNGETYTASGDYTYTTTATNGCDSVVTLHLTINKSISTEETITACDSHTWNGETYTESGDYTYNTTATNGCDSIVTLHLTINKAQYAEATAIACDSYTWNGETYTESGDYTYTTTATNGCDSIVTLHLTINKSIATEETITACDSHTWNGETYTESGDYTYTTTATNGCDSIVTLHLTINKSIATDETVVTCDSYTWNGETYTASGDYTYTTTATNGCDSIVTLHLTLNKTQYAEATAIACDSYTWNGETYTASGEYTYTTTAANGCDSVVTLHLTINKTQYAEETVTACDSYTWNGETYTGSGDYTYTTTATNGCDSIVTLHLTINKSIAIEETITACDSYTWTDGKVYTESGTYTQHLKTVNACDSIVTLHLTVNKSSVASDEYATICYGDSYTWNNQIYNNSGDYTLRLENVYGCDSVVTLHLTVLPPAVSDTLNIVIGSNELPYLWRGKEYTSTGTYYDIDKYVHHACDSAVHVLDLTVLFTDNVDYADATICESSLPYTWYDQQLTTSGKYSYIEQYVETDIDSIQHILNLTVIPTAYVTEYATACDSYTWTDGKEYTESGIYTQSLQTVNGCDSIVTLHLTVNKSSVASDEYATICYGERYTWNSKDYQANGDYTITLSNAAGCDSVVTLHLVVLPEAVADTLSAVVGADDFPYLWRGKEYTVTGLYVDTEQYATIDCDSAIHYLDLTVLSAGILDEQSLTLCETELPYLWYDQSLTTAGKYSYTEQYAGTDIDSVQHILHLIVNPIQYTEETITACDSYEWNGETYTESGDYIYTTIATTGCDSIVTLHLTILPTPRITKRAYVCYGDSYEWYGEWYDATGEYSTTLASTEGCDTIATLYLTVMPETVEDSEEVIVCASDLPYYWYGRKLTKVGVYTHAEPFAKVGCDSVIHTLTLDTYKMTLPNAVTLPTARAGEPINTLVPTEEIQAHIDAQTWYAPNPIISWYVMQNAVWTEVSDEPVGEDVQDLILKYAVDTDCGKVESKNMKISVIPTAVDDITASDECTVRKVIMDDKVFIIRGNKMYSLMGVEVR